MAESPLTVDRRAFLASLAAAGLLPPGVAAAAAAPPSAPSGAPAGAAAPVTVDMLPDAEAVAGLEFTGAERELMLDGVNDGLKAYEAIRGVAIDNAVPPALAFSPLAAGHKVAAGKSGVAWNRPRDVRRPATDAELAFLPVTHLAELLRSRQVSSEELTRLYLERLKAHGPRLECVITLTEDRAIAQARQADAEIRAGRYRGPLHGIPWGAKDLLAVPGYRTTWGCGAFRDQVRPETAAVVERLDSAGAVLVAKLTLGELAWGDVWYGGTTKNPWKLDQGSSGSSAGSASATVAGLVGFSIGSETLGSIVSPSVRCGATGLRPTFGRVSRHGAMALSWSMDKLGPICRSVEDCALVFQAIHGPDGRDLTVVDAPFAYDGRRPVASLRVGYVPAAFEEDHPTRAHDLAALEALKGLGVTPVPLELPAALPVDALRIILNVEAATAFDELTRSGRDDQLVRQVKQAWPNVFRQARLIPAVEYLQANRVRTMLMAAWEQALAQVDVLVTPPFARGVLLATNLTGHPTVVVPSGFNEDGTPVGLTFVGRLFGEADALLLARAWQEATGFHRRHPPAFA